MDIIKDNIILNRHLIEALKRINKALTIRGDKHQSRFQDAEKYRNFIQ